jgi:hypothetical protein
MPSPSSFQKPEPQLDPHPQVAPAKTRGEETTASRHLRKIQMAYLNKGSLEDTQQKKQIDEESYYEEDDSKVLNYQDILEQQNQAQNRTGGDLKL